MFEIHMAVSPALESRMRSLIQRKRKILQRFQREGMSDALLREIGHIEMELAKFAEQLFAVAEKMNAQPAQIDQPAQQQTLH